VSSIYISAAHKSSGKTSLSIGLARALRDRGLSVQTFKKGPDYIDPLWLTSASGRSCYNLDFHTQNRQQIERLYARHLADSEVGLIEGNLGLFDGMDLEGSNSNAALAALLDVPVVLVINTKGMTRGIAPLLLGYQAFDHNIRITGVILNQVRGSRHQTKLTQVVEHYTDLKILGAVQHDPQINIDERHLGLIPSNEQQQSERVVQALADTVRRQIDLDGLLAIAATAKPPVAQLPSSTGTQPYRGLRIGYPKDPAFGFYYPDDLDRMRELGVELIRFNALEAPRLPQIDGLFIGGGFPETAMHSLERNASLREDVAGFIEGGGVAYAECGGLIYLSRSLTWGEKKCKMVGIIPADTVMHEKPQGRGYVQLRQTGHNPWLCDVARQKSDVISAHEFHYSSLEGLDPNSARFAYEVVRGTGIDGQHDGFVYKNLLASYTHRRSVGEHGWVDAFLAQVNACKKNT
jgi:cobyrinic acid a,c-diamide synthase